MTPDEAAAVLGVRRDADGAEIDRAYRHLARELHPDRFAGRPAADIRAANERFVDVTRARDVLLRSALDRVPGPANGTGGTGGGRGGDATAGADGGATGGAIDPTVDPDRRRARGGRPDARGRRPLELVAVRHVDAAARSWGRSSRCRDCRSGARSTCRCGSGCSWAPRIATGLTGRRWVWRTTLVLIGVNAVATVLATTIGGLLGLGFMIVASFGLAVQVRLVRFPDQ